jgi:hypothetical protein
MPATQYDAAGRDADGFDREGFDHFGYDRDGYDREGINDDNMNRAGDYYCGDCERAPCTCDEYDSDDDYDTRIPEPSMRNYFCDSFNPAFQFKGKGPLYFGMELEITAFTAEQARIASQRVGELGWLKSDATVRGFEMAMHPMSYPYFQRQFPWDMLPELEAAGCEIHPMSNGMHIHVSRDGFRDVPHQYRWMKLFYRNRQDVVRIGGRDCEEWGAFDSYARRLQVNHLKIRKMRAQGRRAPRGLQDIGGRYNAINTQPSDTFEIRAFASTLDKDKARARLQLAAGTIAYTRNLTAHDITRGGWEWPAFANWVSDRKSTYPQLARVL